MYGMWRLDSRLGRLRGIRALERLLPWPIQWQTALHTIRFIHTRHKLTSALYRPCVGAREDTILQTNKTKAELWWWRLTSKSWYLYVAQVSHHSASPGPLNGPEISQYHGAVDSLGGPPARADWRLVVCWEPVLFMTVCGSPHPRLFLSPQRRPDTS